MTISSKAIEQRVRTVGFPNSNPQLKSASEQTVKPRPIARPNHPSPQRTPPANKNRGRSKGSWFVRLFVISVLLSTVYMVWCQFGKYRAYGSIRGRVIKVSSATEGSVRAILVKNEETVRQGQLLALLEDDEAELKQRDLRIALDLALANFAAKLADLQMREDANQISRLETSIDYYQQHAALHLEKAKLDKLTRQRNTNRKLSKSISKLTLADSESDVQASASQIEYLKKSIAALEDQLDQSSELAMQPLLKPYLVEIRRIEAAIGELDSRRRKLEIRAPTSGKIIARHSFAGEYIRTGDVVFELLEEGSREAAVLIRQGQVNDFQIGTELQLEIEPHRELVRFRIESIETAMAESPARTARFYLPGEKLVTLVARPVDTGVWADALFLDAEVRLPRMAVLAQHRAQQSVANEVGMQSNISKSENGIQGIQ